MTHSTRRFALGALLLFGFGSAHAQVVISQAYGGGGNSGAALKSDFIELHNNGNSSVDLSTWTVQYASSAGSSWAKTNLTGSIAAGGYYLVKEADGNGAVPAISNQDATGTIAMGGTGFKLALVNSTTALTGTCPSDASIQDFVGAGGSASCYEGAGAAPAPSNTSSIVRLAAGCTDTNVNSADFETAAQPLTPRNSSSDAVSCNLIDLPTLSIDDVTQPEGDSGTTNFVFTITLSELAPEGGVSFTATTSDDSAVSGSDFTATSTVVMIAAGETTTTFSVPVHGDTDLESNETFLVNLSSPTEGYAIGDGEGLGTITNDDIVITSIGVIQSNGELSPHDGQFMMTEGVVTAKRGNGFFLQSYAGETAAAPDGDDATSDGIFVFTGAAPDMVAIGDHARVAGTVSEFSGSAATPTTELVSPAVDVLDSGITLPTPVELSAIMAGPDSLPDTLEHLEGMLVSVAEGLVTAQNGGFISESSATSGDSNSAFEFVVTGVPRPLREPGISIFDLFPVPPAKAATIPYFDANQERIKAFPLVGTRLLADAGATVTGLVGALTYFGDSWELLYDVANPPVIGAATAMAVSDAGANDITVAGFNLQRFFDTVNDPSIGEPVLTGVAFANRLAKTGAAICDWVKAPDILGVVEVENLGTLTELANYINGNCANAPAYAPYLQEGNDVGGIDVGFLVSNRAVRVGVSRVQVASVTQYGKDTKYGTSPLGCVPDTAGCTSSLLNDRPSLVLRAAVNFTNGRNYPLTVIVNHLRSLNGNDDPADGRVRYKRAEQAVELAKLVNGIQTGNPSEKVVLVGDFNAFPFNDGYVDVMGIVTGNPAAEDEVVEYRASPLATPLVLGDELIADPLQRYSYVFEGNAQTLDHAVVNEALVNDPAVVGLTVEHARINGDFRVAHYGEFNLPYTAENPPLRVSDHDPVRLKIELTRLSTADLSLSFSAPQPPGRGVAYSDTLTLRNDGPEAAVGARLHLYLQTTDFTVMTVQAPTGWSCRSSTPHYTYDCTASTPVAAGAELTFKVNQRDSRSHATSNPYRLEAQIQATTLDLLQDNNEAVQLNQ